MSRRLDEAEKVARIAERIVAAIPADELAKARRVHGVVPGGGGQHYILNSRLVNLADALGAWRAAKADREEQR